ncbi:unnamed protein product [Musa hybrid cultivar]
MGVYLLDRCVSLKTFMATRPSVMDTASVWRSSKAMEQCKKLVKFYQLEKGWSGFTSAVVL